MFTVFLVIVGLALLPYALTVFIYIVATIFAIILFFLKTIFGKKNNFQK